MKRVENGYEKHLSNLMLIKTVYFPSSCYLMQTGLIQADDIKKFYSVKGNPEVMAGKIKEDEAFAKFLDTFDSIQKDGTVTFEVDA